MKLKHASILLIAAVVACAAVSAEDPKSRVIRRLEALNVENVRLLGRHGGALAGPLREGS